MNEKILAIVARETGHANVTPATSFDQLGIDSLEFIHLLNTISEELRVTFAVSGIETVGDLLKGLDGTEVSD